MKNRPTSLTISQALVRARGNNLFFESIPEIRPTVADGFVLIAIILTGTSVEAKVIQNDADYAVLISQSQVVGAYFQIKLYSFPQNLLPN